MERDAIGGHAGHAQFAEPVVEARGEAAGQPPRDWQWGEDWTILFAWLPVIVFGPLAVWRLDRVKT